MRRGCRPHRGLDERNHRVRAAGAAARGPARGARPGEADRLHQRLFRHSAPRARDLPEQGQVAGGRACGGGQQRRAGPRPEGPGAAHQQPRGSHERPSRSLLRGLRRALLRTDAGPAHRTGTAPHLREGRRLHGEHTSGGPGGAPAGWPNRTPPLPVGAKHDGHRRANPQRQQRECEGTGGRRVSMTRNTVPATAQTQNAQAWQAARRVLAVRLDSLGDLLMTGPALRALKEQGEGRTLTLLTSPAGAQAAQLLPFVDDVIVHRAPWMKPEPDGPGLSTHLELLEGLQARQFDAAVIFTVFSQSPLPAALTLYLAGIPLRLAYSRSEEHTSELQSRGHLVC